MPRNFGAFFIYKNVRIFRGLQYGQVAKQCTDKRETMYGQVATCPYQQKNNNYNE